MNVTNRTAFDKHDYQEGVSCQNKYGEWVPAIPEPYWQVAFMRKAECWTCPAANRPSFKDEQTYRGHYALVHILGL